MAAEPTSGHRAGPASQRHCSPLLNVDSPSLSAPQHWQPGSEEAPRDAAPQAVALRVIGTPGKSGSSALLPPHPQLPPLRAQEAAAPFSERWSRDRGRGKQLGAGTDRPGGSAPGCEWGWPPGAPHSHGPSPPANHHSASGSRGQSLLPHSHAPSALGLMADSICRWNPHSQSREPCSRAPMGLKTHTPPHL